MATGVTLVDVDDDDDDDPGPLDEHAAVRNPRLKIIAPATSRLLSEVPNTVLTSPGLVGWEVHVPAISDGARRQRVGGFILGYLGYRPGPEQGAVQSDILRPLFGPYAARLPGPSTLNPPLAAAEHGIVTSESMCDGVVRVHLDRTLTCSEPGCELDTLDGQVFDTHVWFVPCSDCLAGTCERVNQSHRVTAS
jgi:hypothetical protein